MPRFLVALGRDRLEWRQTAEQSVSLAWLPLSQARQPTFHLYQPGASALGGVARRRRGRL